MTTNSSVSYSMTRDDILLRALQELNIVKDDEVLPTAEINLAANKLNMLLKNWQAQGIHIWQQAEYSQTLTASTSSYSITSPRVLEITSARLRITTGTIDQQMVPMSREEYFNLPNKTSTGYPRMWYYDPGRVTTGTLYVWPTPDTTIASACTIKYTGLRPLADVLASADEADVPAECLKAVVLNLAYDLSRPYEKSESFRQSLYRDAQTAYMDMVNPRNAPGSGVSIGLDLEAF